MHPESEVLRGVLSTERVDRRLAAVLAADVAGYSRLMGADEEGTLARLKAVRNAIIDPTIASHRGRIVKTTGDGLLVEFASAVDAVRCSVEVQRAMAAQNADVAQDFRIEFRIGIHVGDIIIDDNDIFGDGVNIASRLEGIAEPGGVCMSEDAYRQVRGKIQQTCDDLGPKNLKNIADPMRAWRIQVGNAPEQTRVNASISSQPSLPKKPSIVVLPLLNLTGDPEQEYFADGLTQSLTTDLSRFRGLFVIGRNTAFTYKGKSINLKEIGITLGVRYLLEGSVQRSGERIRVSVDLIEAQTGGHLWAERFDRNRADLFEIQDEIGRRVAYSLSVQIGKAERDRGELTRSSNPDSVDLVLRALALAGSRSKELNTRISLYEQAAQLDPSNPDAWAGLARGKANLVFAGWSSNPGEDLRSAASASHKALDIDSNNPDAIFAKGQVFLAQRNFAAALEAYEHACELNPSHPNYHQLRGVAKLGLGKPIEAIEPIHEAIRLSPRDFFIADFYMCLGWAYWDLGEYEQAKNWLERSIAQNSGIEATHFLLASTLIRMGQSEEAAAVIKRVLNEKPHWTVHLCKLYPLSSASQPSFLKDMHDAGLPDA
jgi:adenylate cyclase